jgi:hypothetical protein
MHSAVDDVNRRIDAAHRGGDASVPPKHDPE